MINQLQSSFKPVPSHCLQGKPLKQWWQAAEMFALKKTKSSDDRYLNAALRAQILFLLQLPFTMALAYQIIGPTYKVLTMMLLAGLAGLAVFTQLIAAFKQQCKIIHKVTETEEGLILEAPRVRRTIRWGEIKDFFPIASNDHVLDTGKEQFVLSSDLTHSAELFDHLLQRLPKNVEKFAQNYRLPNGFVDSGSMACFAIMLSVILAFLAAVLVQQKPLSELKLESILIVVALPVTVWVWKTLTHKTAEIFRISDTACRFYTRAGEFSASREQITAIDSWLPGCVVVRTRTGWFSFWPKRKIRQL